MSLFISAVIGAIGGLVVTYLRELIIRNKSKKHGYFISDSFGNAICSKCGKYPHLSTKCEG